MTATSWYVVYCNDEQIGRRVERWPSPRTTSESSLAALGGEYLELITDPHQAVDSFEEALRLLPPSCDRRQATIAVGLAHAHLASGELEEAQRRAATALIVFAEHGSVAGLHRVRGVRDAFREAGHHAAALALDEQARAVRVAASG